MSSNEFTGKQRKFIEAYLGPAFFNATESARIAGYSGNDNVLGVSGYRLLRDAKIADEISTRLNEAAMSPNEVLFRLSAIARGDLDDVIGESGTFDLEKARKGKKTGLLKKLKQKRTSKRVDTLEVDGESETLETSLIYEEVEFEMYSAHEALRDLAKYHKLLVDRTETKHTIDLSQLTDEELQEFAKIASRLRLDVKA